MLHIEIISQKRGRITESSQAIVGKTPFPVFRKQSVHNISKNLPLQQENNEESKKALYRTGGNSRTSKLTSTKNVNTNLTLRTVKL